MIAELEEVVSFSKRAQNSNANLLVMRLKAQANLKISMEISSKVWKTKESQ